jgi:hypothetical protein
MEDDGYLYVFRNILIVAFDYDTLFSLCSNPQALQLLVPAALTERHLPQRGAMYALDRLLQSPWGIVKGRCDIAGMCDNEWWKLLETVHDTPL